MASGRRAGVALAALAALVVLEGARGEAHKPITSPYTFNEDVFPILHERCSRCHVQGGVGPMSLMTHQDTVPWSESIRIELMAGHMPPWDLDASSEKLRHARSLTARELNVLLTWASGGTPMGAPDKTPTPTELERGWQLGTPDAVIPLPEFAMGADTQEDRTEFTLATAATEPRWLRAVDLQPGTPAILRGARIVVKSASSHGARDDTPTERVLAVWVPGDDAVALEDGAGFRLPAGAELVVSMRYKKTWEYERSPMTDRSSVGLYFAPSAVTAVRAVTLTAPPSVPVGQTVAFTHTVEEDLRALAIYPDVMSANMSATVDAIRPDGSREQLLAFRAQRDWARRFWFAQPVTLARGTRIDVRATLDEAPQALPNKAASSTPTESTGLRFTLNVIPATR